MAEPSESSVLAEMPAEIVSARVAQPSQPAGPPNLISTVAGQLGKLGTEVEQPVEPKLEPAVPVRRSVRPDRLICLVCGKPQKVLKRHLAVQHGLMPPQYREQFGLKSDYPMAAPNYAQRRRALALSIGLGRPKKPARRTRKLTARPKAPRSSQSATTKAGS